MREFTGQQRRAIERRDGSLIVRAGAGAGKTSVLVERFVLAVTRDGERVDSILAITFTEKAAAQLRSRVRERFLELGRRDLARETERAWISTIHGFCSRVLRAHALTAGIDPDYRVLDELEGERLALDAFDGALEDFLAEGADPRRLEMVATYTPDKLRDMVRTAYSRLRSQGHRYPELPEIDEPVPSGEDDALDRAARAALAELGTVPAGAQVEAAMAVLERCLEGPPPEPGGPLDALKLKGSAKALKTDVCARYEEARSAYSAYVSLRRQWLDQTLLRELLALFGGRFERAKRGRSGLDFEDLELIARDVLEGNPGLREQYAGRFRHVMVDEFQDTNPLQNEILELLERDNLFRVGDENQSIYGFRHADVEVFRKHHRDAHEAGRAEKVTVNFRSRGEVLDAIDLAFSRVWGEDFEPLLERPGARDGKPRVSPSVELLVTDLAKPRWDERFPEAEDPEPFGAAMRSATPWRAAEARLLAKRVEEVVREGKWKWGDVVMLLRASTHMTFYERALEERGIPTHVVGGRGYWSQQQVTDLRHWLSALANPMDELAIYSILASPLVGASLDAVALVGLHARAAKRDVWWTLSDGLPNGLPERDARRIGDFVRLFASERRAAARRSLETLIDRAVTLSGYDQRVLALPAGDRRMANVRKLMRMAREFEADEGRDLRGFIDAVADRDEIQQREGEAPLEAEELDAVRLMTVHRAKGLEFPVVCVADLGKSGREDYGALRISDDGRLGLRLARLGGGATDSAEMERIREEQKLADEEEEKRIFYVAATRAEEHLILSGATDLEKKKEEKPLDEPMRWIWRGFCAALPSEGATGEVADAYEGREVRVRYTRLTPATVEELLPPADRKPALPAPKAAQIGGTPPLDLGAPPAPRALPVSRLSYSSIESYAKCGYRFYAERALRLPRIEPAAPGALAAPGLSALLRGTVVHELLERLDFRRPVVPSDAAVRELLAGYGHEPLEGEVEDLQAMVEGFVASPLRERLSRASQVRAELQFAFTLDPGGGRSVLMNGVVDAYATEPEGTLIVDYKSDRLEGRDPEEVCARDYGTQRLVYALAALRSGAERVEVVHIFLERPEAPATAIFSASDSARLERDLLDLARGLVDGRFTPTDAPHADLCATCPAQPALCSWPPERTLGPHPDADGGVTVADP